MSLSKKNNPSSVKANFFLVGAAKAGTTTLYNYLKQHPQVFMSPVKEPNYFSTDINIDDFAALYRKNTFLDTKTYFSHDTLSELQLTFVKKPEHYQRLFENAGNASIVGEASTSYLFSEIAAQNIYKYNPEAKILVMLRNPISRTFSHYLMALRYGHTKLSFRQAVEQDQLAPMKGWGISELYIELSLYAEALQRFFDIFPREQVLVCLYDTQQTQPNKVMEQVFRFLNIEPIILNMNTKYNTGRIPRFKKLNAWIAASGLKNRMKSLFPDAIQQRMKQLAFHDNTAVSVQPEDVDYLKDFFEEDIRKTASLTGLNLEHWLKNF